MCTLYDQIENQGLTKGRAEGYLSAQTDAARSMKAEGIPDEQIARILRVDETSVRKMLL